VRMLHSRLLSSIQKLIMFSSQLPSECSRKVVRVPKAGSADGTTSILLLTLSGMYVFSLWLPLAHTHTLLESMKVMSDSSKVRNVLATAASKHVVDFYQIQTKKVSVQAADGPPTLNPATRNEERHELIARIADLLKGWRFTCKDPIKVCQLSQLSAH
jgi:hypothetical protein